MMKMKRRYATLIMLTILVFVFVAVITATANYKTDIEGYACGTLTQYNDDPDLPAELLDGVWNLKIADGKVWFYACITEMNHDPEVEDAPENSIDLLEYSIIGKPMDISEDAGVISVFGVIQVKKTAAQWDGSYSYRTWTTWELIEVDTDADAVTIINNPKDDSYWKLGTVSYHSFS
jgi:hypothetical protein